MLACTAALAASLALPQIPFADAEPISGVIHDPVAVATGDLDGDGSLDLVVASGRLVLIRRGSTDGAFAMAEVLFESPTVAERLLVEDLDGDGDVEVCTIDANGTLRVSTLLFDGTYAVATTILDVHDPQLADMDADGRSDVVSYAPGVGLTWRRWQGGLDFDGQAPLLDLGASVSQCVPTDQDGDGDLDLIVASKTGAYAGLWSFENTGTFPFHPLRSVNVGAQAPPVSGFCQILGLDTDGDGDEDLVTRGAAGDLAVRLIENLGGGAYAGAGQPVGGDAEWVSAADADGDGATDLVMRAADTSAGSLSIALGDGLGGFTSEQPFGTPLVRTRHVVFADFVASGGAEVVSFDDNGSIDLRIWSGLDFDVPRALQDPLEDIRMGAPGGDLYGLAKQPRRIIRRKRLAAGGLGTTEVVLEAGASGLSAPLAFTVGDIDRDGRDDLVVALETSAPGTARVVARIGLAGGNLGPVTDLFLAPSLLRIMLLDVDADGALDAVTWEGSSPFGGNVAVARNLGAGAFASPALVDGAPISYLGEPLFVDADADGFRDVIVQTEQSMDWFRGLGDGTFAARSVMTGPSVWATSTVAEMDGDGIPDLLRRGFTGGADSVIWRKGTGSGSFGGQETLIWDAPYSYLRFGDLDQDGLDDMVAVRDGDTLVVRRRLTQLSFSDEFQVGLAAPEPILALGRLMLMDYDEDGDLDIAGLAQFGPTPALEWVIAENLAFADIGEAYCAFAHPNATGAVGELGAFGSSYVFLDRFELRASRLPPQSAGFFLTSRLQGVVNTVPNSVGTLCLGGSIGRFVGPSQVGAANAGGELRLDVDLSALPTASLGAVPALPGQTWHFQGWYRDRFGGQPTSNFTTGLTVTFR